MVTAPLWCGRRNPAKSDARQLQPLHQGRTDAIFGYAEAIRTGSHHVCQLDEWVLPEYGPSPVVHERSDRQLMTSSRLHRRGPRQSYAALPANLRRRAGAGQQGSGRLGAGNDPARAAAARRSVGVPPGLTLAAAWAWRMLIVGVVLYLIVTFLAGIPVVTVPIFLALLFTALLHRPVGVLRRFLPDWLAALLVSLGAVVVIGGVIGFVVVRIEGRAGSLVMQIQQVFDQVRAQVQRLPGSGGDSVDLVNKAQTWVESHTSSLLSVALSVGRSIVELIVGLVLTLFLTLFFLTDGEKQWGWVVRLLPTRARPVVNGAGQRAFSVLAGWIGGTAIIALIHAVIIGATMWVLGTPLALALTLLVFFGSFIPIVGAFVFGGLAVLVTWVSVGLWPAVILLAVLVVEDLLEGHVYQPLIMGRTVKLHPVIILIALTAGSVLAGIIGAIISIPIAAATSAAVKYVKGVEDIHGDPVPGSRHEVPEASTVVRLSRKKAPRRADIPNAEKGES